MEEITKFVTMGLKQINSDEVTGLLRIIDSTLKDMGNMQRGLEKRLAQLQKQYNEINSQISDARKQVKEATKVFYRHRRSTNSARTPTISIQVSYASSHGTHFSVFSVPSTIVACRGSDTTLIYYAKSAEISRGFFSLSTED